MKRLDLAPVALAVGVCSLFGSAPARAQTAGTDRCYIAFIHGSGDNFHDEDPGSARLESYWAAGGQAFNSFVYYAGRQWAGEAACKVWRVGYDGNQQWWSDRAAGRVAASLHDFIDQNDIPDGKLVLVGHSMGGVLARYLIGNGTPQAPYYNEYVGQNPRMDYDLVRRKTAYIITVQSPHTGSQASDALYGNADHSLANGAGGVVRLFNMRERTPATDTMTRSYMEAAGAPGGELADGGRETMIYTIAGTDSGEASGLGTDLDGDLDLAWILLCYKKGARNSWGSACQWDFWNFTTTAGDGLVERSSAHAWWMRAKIGGQGMPAGRWRQWLDVIHNHNQGRYDAMAGNITDKLRGGSQRAYLGSYVGSYRPAPGAD
jgi:hypothetical protein